MWEEVPSTPLQHGKQARGATGEGDYACGTSKEDSYSLFRAAFVVRCPTSSGAQGYLFEMERRGYLKIGRFGLLKMLMRGPFLSSLRPLRARGGTQTPRCGPRADEGVSSCWFSAQQRLHSYLPKPGTPRQHAPASYARSQEAMLLKHSPTTVRVSPFDLKLGFHTSG